MPLGRKLAIEPTEEQARRQRAELRTSYGNKLSNMNLDRLRSRSNALSQGNASSSTLGTASLRRIASSFAHVSDVGCGSCAALPHEDSEDDAKEERAEVLIRSEPFKTAASGAVGAAKAHTSITTTTTTTSTLPPLSSSAATMLPQGRYHPGSLQSRANERWGQIACTVSALFRVRRISHAHPMSELRRLREQRDLLEAFTRPFLYDEGTRPK